MEENLGCKYVNKQGPNKGKRCNASCRGDYCHLHKESVSRTKHKYYEKVKAKLKEKRDKTKQNATKIIDKPIVVKKNDDSILSQEEIEQYKRQYSQPIQKPSSSQQQGQPQTSKKPWIRIFGR